MLAGTQVSWVLEALPTAVPLADRMVLTEVTAPVLVIAAEQDPAHQVWVAERLASGAHLEVLPTGGIMWRHRAVMRDLIGEFLSDSLNHTTLQ
jgi:pimeloyl-ACP methyl ester carboxylesterase